MIQREPEEEQTSEVEEQTSEVEVEVGEKDTETLKQALAEEREKAKDYLANWQRAQADFVNYKRRSEQEKELIGEFASSALMLSLLPILGDLERAFASIPPDVAKLSWVDGIRLIERSLRAGLEAQGLSSIAAVGEPFDPKLHEAVREDKGEEGIVIEEVEKGYRLHDRVIRPSKVVIGNGKVEEEPENNLEN